MRTVCGWPPVALSLLRDRRTGMTLVMGGAEACGALQVHRGV
jgi:hypothetical protein